jgi:hypothetical protein
MSHFILKLTSGENVYGVLDMGSVDKKMVIVENPMVWEEYENPETGQTGTALVKYLTGTAESKIPVALSSIISMAAMSDTFSNFYDAAVAVAKIMDDAYDERIAGMTHKMVDLIIDYQDKAQAEKTGELVISSSNTTTIH